MNTLTQLLDGRKTYITGILAILLVVAHWAGVIEIPSEAYVVLFGLAVVFLRSGITKSAAEGVEVKINQGPRDRTLYSLAIVAGVASMLVAGCVHTPEAERYLALSHTKTVVLEGMDLYGYELASGRVDAETEAKIDQAYLKFSAAFKAAVKLARYDYQAPTPESVLDLSFELLDLINQATQGP